MKKTVTVVIASLLSVSANADPEKYPLSERFFNAVETEQFIEYYADYREDVSELVAVDLDSALAAASATVATISQAYTEELNANTLLFCNTVDVSAPPQVIAAQGNKITKDAIKNREDALEALLSEYGLSRNEINMVRRLARSFVKGQRIYGTGLTVKPYEGIGQAVLNSCQRMSEQPPEREELYIK